MIDPSDSFLLFGIQVILLTVLLAICCGLTFWANNEDLIDIIIVMFLGSILFFAIIYGVTSPEFTLLVWAFGSLVILLLFLSQLNTERILIVKKSDQIRVSVKSSILELKSKIKFFKIKGIETDELELILGKVKKEMARTVQSPSTALALEISANNKKAKASGVIFVAYNCYILVLIFI